MNVPSINPGTLPLPPSVLEPAGGAQQGGSFKELLIDSLREVSTMQSQADQAVVGLMTGEDVNPAEVMTAVQKADVAFRLMLQIRNKLVEAYNEVQNIRV